MYKTGKYFVFLITCIALVLPSGQAEIASSKSKHKDSEEHGKGCDSVKIQCLCGIGSTKKTVEVELKMYTVQDPVTNKTKCSGYPDPYQKCASKNCMLSPNSTVTYGNNGTSEQKLATFLQAFYPKEFSIPRGAIGERHTRQGDPCHVTPLKNAEIKCWKWPNWM